MPIYKRIFACVCVCGGDAGGRVWVFSLRMSQGLALRTAARRVPGECVCSSVPRCECIKRWAPGPAGDETGGPGERPGGGGGVEEVRTPHSPATRSSPAQPPPLPRRQVISLTFGKFDLEPDSYCRYDSVSVFNGPVSDDAKRLGKFCGDTVPG